MNLTLTLSVEAVNLCLAALNTVEQQCISARAEIVAQGNAQVPQQPAPAQPAQEQANANHNASANPPSDSSADRSQSDLAYCARLEGVAEAESGPDGPSG